MKNGAPLAQVFAAADAGVVLGRTSPDLVSVPLDTIVPCRWQPRQVFEAGALLDLAKDIEQHGVLTPPLVWMNEDGEWELIAGERRIRACYALCLNAAGKINPLEKAVAHVAEQGFGGLARELRRDIRDSTLPAVMAVATVPCREVWGSVAQLHELALVDNLQRADLTALEEARALHDLIGEYGYTQRVLGERLGKSQTWVSQRLNLLGLTPEVAALVASGEVDPATAREIARLEPGVQAAAVAHLQKFGIKSKQAANLVGRVLDMAQPEYFAGPNGNGENVPARRLAAATLAGLPVAERQEAVLRLAGQNNAGKLSAPVEAHEYKDLMAAAGLAGEGATRYQVDVDKIWNANAAGCGMTCAACRIDAQRGLVLAVNELAKSHKETHLFNREGWPHCAPGVTTCTSFVGLDEKLALPLPWMSDTFPYPETARAFLSGVGSYHLLVRDVAAWEAIIRKYYDLADQKAVAEQDRRENGLVRALTGYVRANWAEDFDTTNVWCQPCATCVFHKVGSTEPEAACQYQANPPVVAPNGSDRRVAMLWRSGNAPAIGRCRLYRMKQPEVNLPELRGGGLDLYGPGVLYLLRQLSDEIGYDADKLRGALWLDVKRASAFAPPAWSACEPVLVKLIPGLSPGRRLALVLLWHDPFGWLVYGNRKTEASAYAPHLDRVINYEEGHAFEQ